MSYTRAAVLLLLLASACAKSHEGPVELCPTLVGSAGSWSGIVLPPGSLSPDGCVEVKIDGERVARTTAASDGSLAVRFRSATDLTGYPIQLEFSDGSREVLGAGATEATIVYSPRSRPLAVDEPGRVTFTGQLASTPDSTPVERAWMVNWSEARVLPFEAPPGLDASFSISMVGSLGDEASPLTRHESGGGGGCWWPRGGGGMATCSEEGFASGACVAGTPGSCTGRGCTPIAAAERESGLGAPEESREIPVAPPFMPDTAPPPPPDGGVPDVGPP